MTIEKILKNASDTGKRYSSKTSKSMTEEYLLDIISINRGVYESSFKTGRFDKVAFCKAAHLVYMKEALIRGLDISEFPEELNYLERQN